MKTEEKFEKVPMSFASYKACLRSLTYCTCPPDSLSKHCCQHGIAAAAVQAQETKVVNGAE
jgi:hypothetical protein